jgi:DNA (cytosine-5)-methyltransferase 1
MKLLDLFCGAGGAAMGYHLAGFTEIVGVDIEPQPNYPFDFIQADVMSMSSLGEFDLIHASPPCQRYSTMTLHALNYPDLIDQVRIMLEMSGRPYVIENVEGAPIMAHLKLCGSMFGLDVQRHRLFELSGFPLVLSPACNHKAWKGGRPWTVTGSGGGGKFAHSWKPESADHYADLMGMPRGMSKSEYSEAIPPAYTKFIGEAFLAQVKA